MQNQILVLRKEAILKLNLKISKNLGKEKPIQHFCKKNLQI